MKWGWNVNELSTGFFGVLSKIRMSLIEKLNGQFKWKFKISVFTLYGQDQQFTFLEFGCFMVQQYCIALTCSKPVPSLRCWMLFCCHYNSMLTQINTTMFRDQFLCRYKSQWPKHQYLLSFKSCNLKREEAAWQDLFLNCNS